MLCHVAYIVWCVYIKLDIHCNTLHVQCEAAFRNILQFSWLRKRFEGLESLSLQTCIQVLYLSSKPHDSFLVEKVACFIAIRKAKGLEVVNEHLLYDSAVLLGIQFLLLTSYISEMFRHRYMHRVAVNLLIAPPITETFIPLMCNYKVLKKNYCDDCVNYNPFPE